MGIARSQLRRLFQNFNIESRVDARLDRNLEKRPQMAPRYRQDEEWISEVLQDTDLREKLKARDGRLEADVGKFDISSTYVDTGNRTAAEKFPHREIGELIDWEYGFFEPPADKIPEGKLTLREAVNLLTSNEQPTRISDEKSARMRRYFAPFAVSADQKFEKLTRHDYDPLFAFPRQDLQYRWQKGLESSEPQNIGDSLRSHLEGKNPRVERQKRKLEQKQAEKLNKGLEKVEEGTDRDKEFRNY